MLIYQVLPRLYGNDNPACIPGAPFEVNGSGRFADFTARTFASLRQMGVTHVWYTGVLQHATRTVRTSFGIPPSPADEVKGQAGSPYAVTDYRNVCPDLAINVERRLHEFDLLVRRTHREGLGVIIDFIPNHVARTYLGSDLTDEDCYPGRIYDSDWSDTAKLDYSRRTTWEHMLDILLYWAARGVDGFRCDMAELVPVEFWAWALPQVRAIHPRICFIAEIYQPWRYREYVEQGTFDYLYDKVGQYNTLIALLRGQESATSLTHCWQKTSDLASHMLHFLENHDEQRLASDFICGDGMRALPALVVSALCDTSPFMIYFGQELGERGMESEGFSGLDGKTTIFDYWSLSSIRRYRNRGRYDGALLTEKENSLLQNYRKVFRIRKNEAAFRKGKFFDLMYINPSSDNFDAHRQYAFLRSDDDVLMLVVANFADIPAAVRVLIPAHAFDYLTLPTLPSVHAVELLSDTPLTITLAPDARIPLTLSPHSAVILRIPLKS